MKEDALVKIITYQKYEEAFLFLRVYDGELLRFLQLHLKRRSSIYGHILNMRHDPLVYSLYKGLLNIKDFNSLSVPSVMKLLHSISAKIEYVKCCVPLYTVADIGDAISLSRAEKRLISLMFGSKESVQSIHTIPTIDSVKKGIDALTNDRVIPQWLSEYIADDVFRFLFNVYAPNSRQLKQFIAFYSKLDTEKITVEKITLCKDFLQLELLFSAEGHIFEQISKKLLSSSNESL